MDPRLFASLASMSVYQALLQFTLIKISRKTLFRRVNVHLFTLAAFVLLALFLAPLAYFEIDWPESTVWISICVIIISNAYCIITIGFVWYTDKKRADTRVQEIRQVNRNGVPTITFGP